MKVAGKRVLGATVLGALAMAMAGCLPEDRSAAEETERLKAELAGKDREIETVRQQVAERDAQLEVLRTKVEELGQQLEQAASMKIPTPDEIDQKLSLETVRLRREAEKQLPNHKIREVTLGEVNIPSPEHPFSCQVTMTLESPTGELGQLYWKGLGDLQGNWTYVPIDASQAAKAKPPATTPGAGPVAKVDPPPATTPPSPPPPKEPDISEELKRRAAQPGGMTADRTIIIDITKMRPINP